MDPKKSDNKMPIDESHPVLNVPTKNIKLWRYLDLPAFFSLLVDSKLCFSRADLMEDKFEGTFPKLNGQLLDEWANIQIARGELNPGYKNLSRTLTQDKTHAFLSCWCQEDTEMVHMWKIYSKEYGVAIETSYEDLKLSINDNENIYPTQISYINFEKDILDWKQNLLSIYTVKRAEYKSECEFRLIISHPRQIEDQLLKYKTHEEKALPSKHLYGRTKVIKINVDLSKLIKIVHISPFAPEWYNELVKSTLIKLGYGDIPTRVSEL
ncbi:DUF2971 domain-containing protein [Desulfurivibrio dismutans]|uniref:DUF2971 domain-containing protein n=1 Tax=Desulfurivibrio dismutans TaxID=1398908 RepID=UPI0023DCBB8E|nr:DUF2971 domain-containing protein [Desulfurivibrio alkaliphilus]MDF1614341.1 DUF2971 domain-containing protein [Desulfurivibrio alkaliphilus]